MAKKTRKKRKKRKKKVDWKRVTNLKIFYTIAFVITAVLSTYLYERDIEPTYYWLPFLIGIVGYIHVKFFHKF